MAVTFMTLGVHKVYFTQTSHSKLKCRPCRLRKYWAAVSKLEVKLWKQLQENSNRRNKAEEVSEWLILLTTF